MLNKIMNKKKDEGFTIIEVLIVLAIAGLILVVVLIAIPQLQRNQRNTARQNDASRVATSVSNWVANNNGQQFVAGTGNANLTAVINDLGALSQYTLVAGTSFTTATGAQSAITNLTSIRVVTAARCGTAGATVGGTGVSTRQFVIQYATESSNASAPTPQCLQV